MEKGTPEEIRPTGDWPGPHGQLYGYDITFTDGFIGKYVSQSGTQSFFKVGEERYYSKEQRQNRNGESFWKIKPEKDPEAQGGQGASKGYQRNAGKSGSADSENHLIRQHAINSAIRLTGILLEHEAISKTSQSAEEAVIEFASSFLEFIEKGTFETEEA